MIDNIYGLNKFLNKNKNIDILNDKEKIIYKNSLREEDNESLIKIYDESIIIALEYINNVNNYLDI